MMTFLQPAALVALPLAAVPVIIHLIHLYRRRQVKWAAMIFLRAAQQMNKGLSRLRQTLILLLRALAVAAILLAAARPLAGGWLGLTGGAPDTVLILLDRSASMEQMNPETGVSKRVAGLRNVAKAINDAVGTRSHLVLMDSALGKPLPLARADTLLDIPQTGPTETAADIPALLQSALDYVTANKTGRTDIWLISDLRQTTWDAASGRWAALRGAFATLPGVRFHLLCYAQPARDDLGVSIDHVTRRETAETAELLLDVRVTRHAEHPQPLELPLRFVVNGVSTTTQVTLKDNQLLLQGYAIPIDKATRSGWGRVELPADGWGANNVFYFVFAEPPPLRSVIVSDDAAEAEPLQAALSAPADAARQEAASVLSTRRAAEIPWAETALIVWQGAIPKAGDPLARQLEDQVAAGRSVLFLPPEVPDASAMLGLRWGEWKSGKAGGAVEWWRNDSGLLANTRDGVALPVGALEVPRFCTVRGEGVPLARLAGGETLLMRAEEHGEGHAYFLGTLPGGKSSSLARDGVVLYALLQRALEQGGSSLGRARQAAAGANALGADPSKWHRVGAPEGSEVEVSTDLPLRAGVVTDGVRTLALNRPASEDAPQTLTTAGVAELFAGLDFRVITGSLEEEGSLTNEVWRTFVICMAAALLGEALLCLPPRRGAGAGAMAPVAAQAPWLAKDAA